MNRMDLNSTHSCDFSYHNITRSQISIDKYNGESKRINIPEKISGQEVVEIGEKAFSNNLIIEHIQLPDSILRINDFAFFGCRNLRKVKFGLGIRKIGDNAFAECESLQDMDSIYLLKENCTCFLTKLDFMVEVIHMRFCWTILWQ